MSTDIFHNDGDGAGPRGPDPFAHMTPLQVFLAASLPLTFVTLSIWAVLLWMEGHKQRVKKLESMLERGQVAMSMV